MSLEEHLLPGAKAKEIELGIKDTLALTEFLSNIYGKPEYAFKEYILNSITAGATEIKIGIHRGMTLRRLEGTVAMPNGTSGKTYSKYEDKEKFFYITVADNAVGIPWNLPPDQEGKADQEIHRPVYSLPQVLRQVASKQAKKDGKKQGSRDLNVQGNGLGLFAYSNCFKMMHLSTRYKADKNFCGVQLEKMNGSDSRKPILYEQYPKEYQQKLEDLIPGGKNGTVVQLYYQFGDAPTLTTFQSLVEYCELLLRLRVLQTDLKVTISEYDGAGIEKEERTSILTKENQTYLREDTEIMKEKKPAKASKVAKEDEETLEFMNKPVTSQFVISKMQQRMKGNQISLYSNGYCIIPDINDSKSFPKLKGKFLKEGGPVRGYIACEGLEFDVSRTGALADDAGEQQKALETLEQLILTKIVPKFKDDYDGYIKTHFTEQDKPGPEDTNDNNFAKSTIDAVKSVITYLTQEVADLSTRCDDAKAKGKIQEAHRLDLLRMTAERDRNALETKIARAMQEFKYSLASWDPGEQIRESLLFGKEEKNNTYQINMNHPSWKEWAPKESDQNKSVRAREISYCLPLVIEYILNKSGIERLSDKTKLLLRQKSHTKGIFDCCYEAGPEKDI